MAFCGNCGTKIENDVKFCSGCGTAVAAPAQPTQQQAQPTPPPAQEVPAQAPPNTVVTQSEPVDVTHLFSPEDIEKNKAMGILAYLVFFVPLIAAKDSAYAKFHANQGFVLFLGYVICSTLWIIPILGWIAAPICYVVVTVLEIMGLIHSISGKARKLPIAGKFKIFK